MIRGENMSVSTREERAKLVAEKWKAQYFFRGEWQNTTFMFDKSSAYENIVLANGDPDAIDKAIGNDSWTRERCNSCGSWDCSTIIDLLEPDYETTPTFCRDCIKLAAEKLGFIVLDRQGE